MHRILSCILFFLIFSDVSIGQTAGVQCVSDRVRSITFTKGAVRDVVVVNGLGYCLTSDLGIMVYDLSDPDHPQLLSSHAVGGNPQNITIHDNLAIVATGQIGVRIYDISDIFNISELGFIDLYTPGRCVVYDGTLILTSRFVYTYDISDPSNPIELDRFDVLGSAWDAVLHGHYLIVGTGGWGISVVDVSNPSDMQLRQRRSTSSDNYDVEIEGDYLYVANRLDGLVVYEISEDGFLELAGSLDIAEDSGVRSLDVENGIAFVSGQDFTVLDVSYPEVPKFLMRYALPSYGSSTYASQQTAFVGTSNGELVAIDIQTPISPILHRLDGANRSYDLEYHNNTLYIANYHSIYISEWPHDSSAAISLHYTPGYALNIDIDDEYLYVADGNAGLSIFRLGGPDGVELVSTSPSEWAIDVGVYGDTAIILDEDAGLMMYDISDRTAPILITTSEVQMDSYRLSLLVTNEDIFVGHGTFVSNYIVNSNQRIVHLDKLSVGQYPYEIDSVGELLAVANGYQGILFINHTDSNNLFVEQQLQIPPYHFHSVHCEGSQMVAAMGDDGFSLFDTSDMSDIKQTADVNTLGFSNSVLSHGSQIFVSDYRQGVLVIDNSQCLERCIADINSDGTLNFFDVSIFMEEYSSQSAESDLNGDGNWNINDVSIFLQSYLSGCTL